MKRQINSATPMVMPLSVWTGSWPPKLADVENAAKPAKAAALARD